MASAMLNMRAIPTILPFLVVLAAAPPVLAHHISGKVLCDHDNDGEIDIRDTPLSGITVTATSLDASPGQTFTDTTDSSGAYNIPLPARTDNYRVELTGLPGGFTIFIPAGGTYTVHIITGTSNDHKDHVNFLLQGCKHTTTTTTTTSTTKTTVTTTSTTTTTTKTTTTKPPTTTTTSTSTTTSSTTTTTTTTSTTSTTLTRLLDHVQCYEIKPKNAPGSAVTVQDQFNTLQESTRYPHRLCAPVSKNGEGILDPVPHLTGYVMEKPQFTRRFNQKVVNQFGTTTLDLVRPDILMVPTAKSLTAPPAPLGSLTIDHFQCYRVKRTRDTPKFEKITVRIADQLESFPNLVLVRPFMLCAPANKNGEDPTAPYHLQHLLCYKTRSNPGFGTTVAYLNNQFGPAQVTLIHRRELCVPSLKNP